MDADWNTLKKQVTEFSTLTSSIDQVTGRASVIYSGLQIKLTEAIASFQTGGGDSLTIFADTLSIDTQSFTAPGILVMARCIDLSAIQGRTLMVPLGADQSAAAEFLIGQVTGGTFCVSSYNTNAEISAPDIITVGTAPLQAAIWLATNGSTSVNSMADTNDLSDLIRSTWAMNSFRASLTAASLFMDSSDRDSLATAQSMLNWIATCIQQYQANCSATGMALPSDFAELLTQTTALLVTLNTTSNAYFVPVLSGDLYQTQLDKLLAPLVQYENSIATLTSQADIARAIATVSSGLSSNATDEIIPLQAQLNGIKDNVAQISADIHTLQVAFSLQVQDAHTKFVLLKQASTIESVYKFIESSIDATVNVISMGTDIAQASSGEDAAAIGEAIKSFVDAVKSAKDAIEDSGPGVSDMDLADKAVALMSMQQLLIQTYQAGAILWSQVQGDTNANPLPSDLQIVAVDPSLAWDNYLICVDAEIKSIIAQIGSGSGSDAATDAAYSYLASLKILSGYGKAVNDKISAYADQMAQAAVLNAQISAAQNIAARWEQQQQTAQNDVEKLALLRGIIQGRSNAIKRAIYGAWCYYRASYFYLNFQVPPMSAQLDINMSVAQMQEALANVKAWVMQALATSADGQHVMLPSENTEISLIFNILTTGVPSNPVQTDYALLVPADGTNNGKLIWNISIGIDQLAGVLPNNGNVAIWITKAELFVDGIKPNTKGNVIATITTSGAYANGFGAANTYDFVSNGLSESYAYKATNRKVYSPWTINTEVYMTPTPYTQWSMIFDKDGGDPSEATQLQMNLTIAYRKQ